jgi:mevalonate kinase
MEYRSTACTKLILAGEHLVVHGYDGLAIPLFEKPTIVTITSVQKSENPSVSFNKKLLTAKELVTFNQDLEFYSDILNLTDTKKKQLKQFSFDIELPFVGVGLGASASFAVAMSKILAEFSGQKLSQQKLLNLALQAEKRYHGNPSGIDHTTIVLEQPILFKGKDKSFIPQPVELPEFWSKVTVHNTGKPNETTKEMVDYVTQKLPTFNQVELDELNSQIPALLESFKANDSQEFARIINLYGIFLESIPICTPETIAENQKIRTKQGAAAKVCGAGGLTNGSGIVLEFRP